MAQHIWIVGEPITAPKMNALEEQAYSSRSYEYAISEFNVAPTTGWSSTFPTIAQGTYLWTRIKGETTPLTCSYIGLDGQTGSTVAIAGVYYAIGHDGINEPTDGWTETKPPLEKGEWLWTKIEYSDGSSSTICSYAGMDGAGADTTIQTIDYAQTESGENIPTSGWQSTFPILEKGKWLWVRTTYSNDIKAYSASYIGTDGASAIVQSVEKSGKSTTMRIIDGANTVSTLTINDGEDGEQGQPGANGYIHIAWANSADGQTDFSTSDSANKLYMGVYSDQIEADSVDPSAYNWTLIKGVGIIGIQEFYKRNNDMNSAPAEPYGTSPLAPIESERYVWNYEEIEYSDGTKFKSNKHIISMFSEAANGRGISSIEEYYAATNSMIAPQDTSFSNVVAAPTNENRYLWNYEVVHYTDGNSEATEKRIIGVYGEKGEDGAPITVSSTSVFYNASEDGTNAPESGWTTTIPSVDAGNYLWTRTDILYSNGTTSSSYLVARQGVDGAAIRVESTELKYQRSQDGKNPPTTWLDAPPNATAGWYMWTQTTTTYSDGNTSVSYSVAKNGSNGINSATIMLYQRAENAPTSKPNQATYVFTDGSLVASYWGGWSTTIPEGTEPCWVIAATASSSTTQDIIESNEWSDPVKFVENGNSGVNQATLYLYKRAQTQPAKPSTQATYTFSTGTLTTVSGWSRTIPSGTSPCWLTMAVALSTTDTDTIAAAEWSTPTKFVDKSIVRVETQYYLSSSNTALVGGSWSTTQPNWQPEHYYWTRSIITWSDDTTTETDAVLANALNTANQNAYEANNFGNSVQALNERMDDLQDQIDGNITSWFYAGAPDRNTEPAQNWTTDEEKNIHLGDLYYDSNTGYCYRWQLANGIYGWIRIADNDITAAMNAAQTAQDTADGKRRVFVQQPTPPYDIGDLWVQGVNGDIMRCSRTKTSAGVYSLNDWVKCSKYTDDSAVSALDSSLNQQAIFNRLTNNGTSQGVYLENGNLYINGSYIKSGTIDASIANIVNINADNITSGKIKAELIEINGVIQKPDETDSSSLFPNQAISDGWIVSTASSDSIVALKIENAKNIGGKRLTFSMICKAQPSGSITTQGDDDYEATIWEYASDGGMSSNEFIERDSIILPDYTTTVIVEVYNSQGIKKISASIEDSNLEGGTSSEYNSSIGLGAAGLQVGKFFVDYEGNIKIGKQITFSNETIKSSARENLDVYSKSEVNSLISSGGSSTTPITAEEGLPYILATRSSTDTYTTSITIPSDRISYIKFNTATSGTNNLRIGGLYVYSPNGDYFKAALPTNFILTVYRNGSSLYTVNAPTAL